MPSTKNKWQVQGQKSSSSKNKGRWSVSQHLARPVGTMAARLHPKAQVRAPHLIPSNSFPADQLEFTRVEVEFIHEIFEPESAQAILSIHLPPRARPNKLVWTLDPKGKFLVRSAYRVTNDQTPNGTEIHWSKLWNLRAPERVKMLLWRIGSNSLPTKDNLRRRSVSSDPICVLCRQENETSQHIFFKCPVARAIWYSSCWGFKSEEHQIMNCEDIIDQQHPPAPPHPPPPTKRPIAQQKISGLFHLIWPS